MRAPNQVLQNRPPRSLDPSPDGTQSHASKAIGVTAEHSLSSGADKVQKRIHDLQ
jgi:hypothetical protein